MVSSSAVPWYNRPPRPFPAKRWLETYYPFRVSPALFAQPPASARRVTAQPREFPAKRWLRERQAEDQEGREDYAGGERGPERR